MKFIYQSFPNRVYFGQGKIVHLAEIIKEIGAARLFVVAGNRSQAIVDNLIECFGREEVLHFSKVIQHVPNSVVEEALSATDSHQSDIIVAIGGGSAIGLAKGIALNNRLPIVAVPTTYAGSEMTNMYGISENGIKTVGRDLSVLPKIVIYDTDLTAEMSLSLAATSSMNAMAHLIEAIYAFDINPITYQNSLIGIRNLMEGMEEMITENSLINANEKLQFGAYLAGKSLCEVSMALHHKMAHVLGGTFDMDHGKVHTVLLPYVLDFQMKGLSALVKEDLKRALKSDNPPQKLKSLAQSMGASTTLKEIGLAYELIPKATKMIAAIKLKNPINITESNIEDLLNDCYHGKLRKTK
ncbi:MAG: maleylacetate reductase [Bacteroidota bacterium]